VADRAGPNSLVALISAALVSGGGGVFVFDLVNGEQVAQLEAHIRTLEHAVGDAEMRFARCDSRIEACMSRIDELKARECDARSPTR
jgi:hypothetical protein